METDVQELEQEIEGVDEEASQEAVPSTANDAAATRQPEKRVNLDEFPEFRQYKSARDRAEAERDRKYQAQLAQLQAAQQEMTSRQLAAMDPEERANYERDLAIQEAAYYRQKDQQADIERNKRNTLQGIAERTKVPVDALMEAESPDHAWSIAWEYNEKKAQEAAKQTVEAKQAREQKRAANKVDLGGGTPVQPASEWDREFQRLQKAGDVRGLYAHALAARQ